MNPSPKSRTMLVLAVASLAALFAAPALARDESAPAEGQAKVQQDRPQIDVVFVLDTTGSMGGLLEGAKQKIWSIASKMAEGKPTPKIRVGLVGYRDRGDEYVTKKFDLTEDLDAVYANLKTFQAGGGGDWPEHAGKGLSEAVQGMQWSGDKRTMKMIFLVGDAPAQEYDDGFSVKTWAKAAIQKGIVVNTVRCGEAPDTATQFAAIAKLADGSFVSIGQTGGMVAVATPFDDELSRINSEIAAKTLYAGKGAAREASTRKARDFAEMAPEAAADRLGFLSKSGSGGMPAAAAPAPTGGAVDLLAKPSEVRNFAADELDGALAGMDGDARVAHVEKLAGERKALEKKAVEVAKKREEWKSKNVAEKEDSFDANVMKDVKSRAKDFGIAY